MNSFPIFIIMQHKQVLNSAVPWYVRHSAHLGLNIYHAMNDLFIVILSFLGANFFSSFLGAKHYFYIRTSFELRMHEYRPNIIRDIIIFLFCILDTE